MQPRKLGPLALIACALPTLVWGGAQNQIKDYIEARSLFWGTLYHNGGTSLYCGDAVNRHDRRYNIEHIFPMSWVKNHLNCPDRQQCRNLSPLFNRIEADLHNLYPARRVINDARGAFAYGLLKGEHHWTPGCDFEVDEQRRRVEPRLAVRGEIARAMLHMHDTYGLLIYSRQGKLLRQWHRDDPPDAAERVRNEKIYQIQKTRNRFIDEPEAINLLHFD